MKLLLFSLTALKLDFLAFFGQFKNNSGTSKQGYFDNCTRDLETQRLKARSQCSIHHTFTPKDCNLTNNNLSEIPAASEHCNITANATKNILA